MRQEELFRRIAALLPSDGAELEGDAPAFRWSAGPYGGTLEPIAAFDRPKAGDLCGMDDALGAVRRNTRAFLEGRPANHVLLTGPRGCGKSTLARTVLGEFIGDGLRVIETDPKGLCGLDRIRRLAEGKPGKFVVYCDDLSFAQFEETFRALKVALEGGLSSMPPRLLVYATSNRRQLIPETFGENLDAEVGAGGEIHPGESSEEKAALADRFGLWVPVFAPDEEEYLRIARHWALRLGGEWDEAARRAALQWAMEKGSRNGRCARQFAVDRAQAAGR